MLARLQLADHHREQLYHRGLSGSDVDRAEYRSLPTGCRARFVMPLRDLFASELLITVPGIIARDGLKGRYLTLAGAPGLLIPVRSAASHVVGLVMRPDDPGEGGKYRWVSSRLHGGPRLARLDVPHLDRAPDSLYRRLPRQRRSGDGASKALRSQEISPFTQKAKFFDPAWPRHN